MHEAGVDIGLGTDGPMSSNQMDIINVMGYAAVVARNFGDSQIVFGRKSSAKRRRDAWRRLVRRRRRAVRLVEELGLRLELLEPAYRDLEKLFQRFDRLEAENDR